MSHNPPNHTHVIQHYDQELERNCLGLLLLGDAPPDWLTPEHFFPAHHQLIFRAVSALRKRRTTDLLARTATLLRGKGHLWTREMGADRHSKPGVLSSTDLALMVQEASWALRQGWAIDWLRLRELSEARALQTQLERLCVRARAAQVTRDEAVAELKEAG